MVSKLLDALADVIPMPHRRPVHRRGADALERLSRRSMEKPPPGRQELVIGHVPDSIVREVDLVTDRLEHSVADQLLDRLRDIVFVHPTGGPYEREVERAPDDRRRRRELPAGRAETLEPARDQIAH